MYVCGCNCLFVLGLGILKVLVEVDQKAPERLKPLKSNSVIRNYCVLLKNLFQEKYVIFKPTQHPVKFSFI